MSRYYHKQTVQKKQLQASEKEYENRKLDDSGSRNQSVNGNKAVSENAEDSSKTESNDKHKQEEQSESLGSCNMPADSSDSLHDAAAVSSCSSSENADGKHDEKARSLFHHKKVHAESKTKREADKNAVSLPRMFVILGVIIAVALVFNWLYTTDFRPFDAVAATTDDGYRLYEDEVNARIAERRKVLGLESDDDWKAWLEFYGYSDILDIRSDAIDTLMTDRALRTECKNHGVMPSDDDIDKYISDYKGLLGLDDDGWEQWLSDNHYDDASYRDNAEYNLMMKNLMNAITTDADDGSLSSDAVLNAITQNFDSSINHTRKVSCIVLRSSEREAADAISKQLSDDSSQFDSLKNEYSESTLLDGWIVLNSYASNLADSVSNLSAGDISDVIEMQTSDNSKILVIARVDDTIDIDGSVDSLDQMPDDFVQDVKDNLSYSGRESSVEQHLSEVVAGWDVVKATVKDEASLPYYVDLSSDGSSATDSSDDTQNDEPGNQAADSSGDDGSDAADNQNVSQNTQNVTQDDGNSVDSSENGNSGNE